MSLLRRAAACLSFASACVLQAAPGFAQTTFCAPTDVFSASTLSPLGFIQRHVEAADLNGDGHKDIVVSTSSGVIIALGSLGPGGTLSYTQVQFLGGLNDPTGTAIADFDGDGIKDLAVACDGGGVSLFRGLGTQGLGSGQFSSSVRFELGSAWDIAAADVTGDGVLDLLVAMRGGALQTMIGQSLSGVGTGTFVAGPAAPVPNSPKGMAVGDIDLDGFLDVVVASESPNVTVLRGLNQDGVASGAFLAWQTISMGGSTYDVTIADFNRDSRPDIASANYTGQSISISLAGVAGVFGSVIVIPVAGSPLGIDSGDFNHDGYQDIVAAATGGGASFTYHQNTGVVSSSLSGIDAGTSFGSSRIGYGITASDLDGDGSLDVLVPNINDVSMYAAFNRCTTTRPFLLVSIVGAGGVIRDPDLPDYTVGDIVQLTASPDPGHTFVGWSGDLTGNANPAFVTMNTTRVITATFGIIQHTLTITTSGLGQGSVTRSPAQPTYDEGSTVTLTAVPAFGSRFVGWSGSATGTANPLDVIMDVDRAVNAAFGPDTTILPAILSISDVPLDQGGKLKLRWLASTLETPGADPQNLVAQYFVWREIPEGVFLRAQAAPAAARADAPALLLRRTHSATRDFFWEFVVALPASRFPGYSYTAATTNDSTELGNPRTAFMIQARNAAGSRWWDSAPDSGYSVDNLAPPTPAALTVRYGPSGNALHWPPNTAPDLARYELHRSPVREFVPGPGTLIASLGDTAYFDAVGTAQSYKLAAVDIHGNRSHYVLVTPDLPTGTLAALVSADASAERITLSWLMSEPGAAATLYRREGDSEWRRLGELAADGRGFMRYDDTDITRGVLYGYRLGVQEAGGESFFAETYVLAEDLRFAITGVTPNPSPGGRMTVRLALPNAGTATLELLDIAGRRIEQHALAAQAGAQSVELGAGARIAPGLYWVRLRQAGSQRSLRAVVLD